MVEEEIKDYYGLPLGIVIDVLAKTFKQYMNIMNGKPVNQI